MYRARERGKALLWFAIIMTVLTLVFVVLWFGASGERDTALARARDAEDSAKKAEEKSATASKDLVEMSKVVGYASNNGRTSKAEVEAAIKAAQQKMRDVAKIEWPADKFTATEGGGVIEKTAGDKVTVNYLPGSDTMPFDSLESFIPALTQMAGRMKVDTDRALSMNVDLAKLNEEQKKAHEAAIKDKDTQIATARQEKAAAEAQAKEQIQDLKDQKQAVEQQRDQAQAEAEAVKKQAAEDTTKYLGQIKDFQNQVTSLVQRDTPYVSEGPDGEVLLSQGDMIIVNRGKADFLVPGTIFQVLGRRKGGSTYAKGEIKVISSDENSARATLLSLAAAADPIVQGDLIQSPIYSPNRKIHFVLVGEFKKMGRSQAEARLKQLGAIVDDKVSADTNYVVVGSPGPGQENLEETEAMKAANELHIAKITEDQLASFTRF